MDEDYSEDVATLAPDVREVRNIVARDDKAGRADAQHDARLRVISTGMRPASEDVPGAKPGNGKVRVWDPLVRIFHWSLVIAMLTAYETPFMNDVTHAQAGYVAAGLVALRVIWGLIGSRHARFSSFVKQPLTVFAFLRDLFRGTATRHLGHNPAGGAMVVALILAILTTSVTGFLMYTNAYQYGDATIPNLHSWAANATLVLLAVHLTGVVGVSLVQR
ncbi:MAG: cytochrome b/b6 domain-containing protein, partial [Paracoccaceae bacterium]|nr:cytochrome b/b6 domain-containing protein [Paracoccaceae bacterium]